jgi:AraC-like DNA-binding protein
MIPPYVQRTPADALVPVVRRLWWLRMPSPQRFERIVPQPAIHLIVNLAADPYRVLARGRERVGEAFSAAFLSGVQVDYLLNENPAELHHVGAELEPWAAGAFGVPPTAVGARVVDARPVMPALAQLTRANLADLAPDDALDQLERALTDARRESWRPDARITAAVDALGADPNRRVAELAADAGLAPKSFSALFVRMCGVTPKRFAEVMRHQAFLAALPAEGDLPPWSTLIADHGYFDQAHFIREFRRFAGMSPSEYVDHRRRFGHGSPSFLPLDEELLGEQTRGDISTIERG